MVVRLLQYSDVENAYDRPERIGRLAGLIADLRDGDTLVVGTGDDTAPGVLSLLSEGRQALDFFSRVEPDLETFGNHDFDYGLDSIREIAAASPQTWVAANVYRNGDGRFGADAGVAPTAIREVDGTRIGFFGVLDPATPDITPTAAGLTVTNPLEAAREAVADLRARGADQVVALSHVGRGDDELARGTGVDVVLGGHVHETRLDRVDGTVLTRPGANGRRLVELQFAGGEWTSVHHDVTGAPVDGEIADALQERLADADLDSVVATAADPIERSDDAIYGGPCRVGRLVAESYRWATGADVGLQNSGGIRSGPPLSGPVAAADLVSLVPFEEPVAVLELSGRELRSVLSERDGRNVPAAPDDRWMGHASGIHGDENGELRVAGESIDPDGSYTLATSDYLRHPHDEFPTLDGRDPVEITDRVQYELVVDYVRETVAMS